MPDIGHGPGGFNGNLVKVFPPLLIALLAVLFYFPVLFQQKTQIHAEGVSVGIALMHMLASAIQGDEGLLWTTSIYGGHPVFAEGQGGFANPLHLLLAWLLPPIQAYNINQFLSMLLGGMGAYGMCRAANCGRLASTFASLALAFSALWIGGFGNLAVGSTMAWIPWVLWAMMNWLKRADFRSSCFFGTTVALMVLSGYPQLVHGVVIYMTIYLLVQVVSRPARAALWSRRTGLAASLGVAILIAVALSAVQWLPLLELANESHRNDGVAILPLDNSTTVEFLRGFLYTFTNPEHYADTIAGSPPGYFPGVGSLLVCLVFSSLIFFRRSPVINGHLLATFTLLVLGFGVGGTPIFRILYDLHLIPGLHSFRVSFIYLYVAVAGFALLTAFSLDQLSRVNTAAATVSRKTRQRWGAKSRLLLTCWVVLWLFVLVVAHVEGVFIGQYAIAAAWLAISGGALLLGYQGSLPVIAVLLLCAEIVLFRIDSYDFGASSLISKPASVAWLEQADNLEDFKVIDRSNAGMYSLHHAKSPAVVAGLEKMLASVTPAANALWGVSSLTGNLALGLQRRAFADPLIDAELTPGKEKNLGYRLIDFASVRYIAVGEYFALPDFTEVYNDPDIPLRIVENPYARPRFQAFRSAKFVQSLEQAIDAVVALDSEVLIIEYAGVPPAALSASAEGDQTWSLVEDRSDRYQLEIQANSAFWMFLGDTNYPGWNAYLDGIPTPVYSAQVLGKAVFVPEGEHVLSFVFEPTSFRLGLAVTVCGACLMVLCLLWQYIRTRHAMPAVVD
tara:strand:+ start:89242 stop:91608 length:2367 start_codon:yes stop_codon:yes gene_type:complete